MTEPVWMARRTRMTRASPGAGAQRAMGTARTTAPSTVGFVTSSRDFGERAISPPVLRVRRPLNSSAPRVIVFGLLKLVPGDVAVTLAGDNGILVTIRGADLHTSYRGSTDLKTGYATLVEVRQVQDFEGVVQLGLGVSGAACYRAFLLSGPDRLVIDVKAQ